MSLLVFWDSGDWLYYSLRLFCHKKLTIKPHQGYLLANAVVLLLLHMCLLLYKRQSRVAPPQQQLRVNMSFTCHVHIWQLHYLVAPPSKPAPCLLLVIQSWSINCCAKSSTYTGTGNDRSWMTNYNKIIFYYTKNQFPRLCSLPTICWINH